MSTFPIDQSVLPKLPVLVADVSPHVYDGVQQLRDGVPVWQVPVTWPEKQGRLPDNIAVRVASPVMPVLSDRAEVIFTDLVVRPWRSATGAGVTVMASGVEEA